MLDAGIDVFSTVNVQHLESLNDQVAELTGVRVRETFPDQVLPSADEVVLVDLTPEALIERLREGKVYPAERVPSGAEQLLPRGEPRPRCARWRCARWPRTWRPSARSPAGGGARHPRGGAVRGGAAGGGRAGAGAGDARPSSQRLVRRAWRSAQRLGADLDLLYVMRPPGPPRGEEREQLEALRRLAAVLGAQLLVEEGDDLVPRSPRAVAAERGTTYVLIGQPRPRTGLRRFAESLARAPAAQAAGRRRADRRRPLAPVERA